MSLDERIRRSEFILVERTPEAKRAYAAGLRMACEIMEWRLDSWRWWHSFLPRGLRGEMQRGFSSLRMGADLIDDGTPDAREEK